MAKSNRLSIPIHPSNHFTWHGREGLTEASCLPEHYFARIWSDSCDVGFAIQSERTGVVKLFFHIETLPDKGWECVAYNLFRSEDGITVKVVND